MSVSRGSCPAVETRLRSCRSNATSAAPSRQRDCSGPIRTSRSSTSTCPRSSTQPLRFADPRRRRNRQTIADVVTLPEHESLLAARDGIEECVSALDREDLVLAHIEHEHLRGLKSRRGAQKHLSQRWIIDPTACWDAAHSVPPTWTSASIVSSKASSPAAQWLSCPLRDCANQWPAPIPHGCCLVGSSTLASS